MGFGIGIHTHINLGMMLNDGDNGVNDEEILGLRTGNSGPSNEKYQDESGYDDADPFIRRSALRRTPPPSGNAIPTDIEKRLKLTRTRSASISGSTKKPAEITRNAEKVNEELRNKVKDLELFCIQLRKEVSDIRAENEVLKKALNDGPGALGQEHPVSAVPTASGNLCATPQTDGGRTAILKRQIADAEIKEEEQFQAMQEAVISMRLAENKQKNVSMSIKSGLNVLEDSLEELKAKRKVWKEARQCLEREAETKPSNTNLAGTGAPGGGRKRARNTKESPDGSPGEQASRQPADKKKKETGDSPGWKEVRRRQEKAATGLQSERDLVGMPVDYKPAPSLKKKKSKDLKPDAVLIQPALGKSYTDVLKEIRDKVKPEDTGTDIRSVRQTRAGHVLLELGSNTKSREEFSQTLRQVLGEAGQVKNLVARVVLEIRDLDSLIEVEDVQEALKRDLGNASAGAKVFVTSPNSRGQKMAIVGLEQHGANLLHNASRIRIGWVNCRVRSRAVVPRCFCCLAYGYRVSGCKGPDRQGRCFKCGGEGHKAAKCEAQAECFLCAELQLKDEERSHIPGTGKCKAFRDALVKAKQTLR